MAKTSTYRSKEPDALGRFTYSAEENAVWRDLMERQAKLLPGRAAPAFLEGLEKLALPKTTVPQLADVDARLGALTGFGVEAVPALITPRRFFSLLAKRKFPAATFIRRREDFDYLQEPDIFHEIFGHCPLLTDASYARFLQRYGELALSLDEKLLWPLQRLFWFTVEFGLMQTPQGLRIYGAGILSSAKETPFALEGAAERQPFDLVTVLRTRYRIDILQPLYYVIESFDELTRLLELDLEGAIKKALALGPLPPLFEEKPKAA